MHTWNALIKKTALTCLIAMLITGAICIVTYYLVSDLLPAENLPSLQDQLLIIVLFTTAISGVSHFAYQYHLNRAHCKADNVSTDSQTTKHPVLESKLQALIVDDNPANRLVINNFLRGEGITTVQAGSGEEAIRQFQEQEFNIVFMDIEMSDTDGLEATQVIRSIEKAFNKSRTPIIGVSAHNEKEKMYQSLAAGFDDYMTKPVKDVHLHEGLKRWCDFDSNIMAEQGDDNAQPEPVTGSIPVESITTRKVPVGESVVEEPVVADSFTENIAEPISVKNDNIEKVVDIQQSLSYSHNNRGLAKDMLELLIKMVRQEKNTLLSLYQSQDWESLSLLTHKLYGGSCYCGVPKLQESCEAADKLLQKKQYDQIDEPIKTLMHAMEEILEWDEQYDIDVIFDV